MKNKKLKIIVLYSSGHLGSSIILNHLQKMSCFEIQAIVKTEAIPISWQGFLKSLKHLQKTGWRLGLILTWQRLCNFLAQIISYTIPFYKERLSSSKDIARKLNIPIIECQNINSPATREQLSSLQPDLLISACFAQILKAEIISIPKIGSLNIHPGLLPDCRGAMSYFHCLSQNHQYAGVTLHWIDEGIDTGEIISHSQFRLTAQMTQQTVLAKAAIHGAKLLNQAGQKILKEQKLTSQEESPKQGQYFSIPNAQDFQLYNHKHRFFRLRDTLRLYLKRC